MLCYHVIYLSYSRICLSGTTKLLLDNRYCTGNIGFVYGARRVGLMTPTQGRHSLTFYYNTFIILI